MLLSLIMNKFLFIPLIFVSFLGYGQDLKLTSDSDTLKLQPGEEEKVCIEIEGDITNGLYFIYNGQQTMIKLKSQSLNTFNLKERTLES